MSDRARRIEERLRNRLDAVSVQVADDSDRHATHRGARAGGGHFRVVVVSPLFEGVSQLAAHRLVYQALGDLMSTDIHALEMRTLTPAAWQDPAEGR